MLCNNTLIHNAIFAQAAANPDAIAAIFEAQLDKTLTYGDLAEKASCISRTIRAASSSSSSICSVQPLVAINTQRSLGMLAGLVGILKSGSAYVPIDPKYPLERQEYIFKDSGCSVLVTDEMSFNSPIVKAALEIGIVVIALDEQGAVCSCSSEPAAGAIEAANDHFEQPADSLAYVIYTSGSTGNPKGVMVPHGQALNMLTHFQKNLDISNNAQSVLALTTFCFDISVMEIFMPLISGARIVLASAAAQTNGFAIVELLNAHPNLTVMDATPATYEMLSVCGFKGRDNLIAVCGGEAFRPDLFAKMQFKRFINGYGPTETTVYSTTADITAKNVHEIPIGTPILNTTILVLDADGNKVPAGESGEMWIGGAGVTRGYLNRPELTAEKFKTFDQHGGERLYRTGDIGFENEAGEYICKGRMDTQVKLRGFRIELGEVESEICKKASSVEVAIVIVRKDLPGGDGLVAYIKLADGHTALDVEGVQAQMKAAIPHYMVPRFFVTMAQFPMTPNFKVDRNQLPKPQIAAISNATPPRTSLEEQLVAIFAEVLGMEAGQVGVGDSFFDLGGHSLLAMRFVANLRDTLQIEISDSALHSSPSVQALAELLSDATKARASSPTSAATCDLTEFGKQEVGRVCTAAGVGKVMIATKAHHSRHGRMVAYMAYPDAAAAKQATKVEDETLKQALIDHTRRELPSYLVPARVVVLPEFPLTTDGEVDTARLYSTDKCIRIGHSWAYVHYASHFVNRMVTN